MLGEVISPSKTLTALSITFGLGAVNVGDVVTGLIVPCHIGFPAEELSWPPFVVLAVSMWTEHSVVCDKTDEMSEPRLKERGGGAIYKQAPDQADKPRNFESKKLGATEYLLHVHGVPSMDRSGGGWLLIDLIRG